MFHVLLVAAGSAVGGVSRFLVGMLVSSFAGNAFPWGTLAINVSGSLFLGWVLAKLTDHWRFAAGATMRAEESELLLAVGIAGGFTTISSFEADDYRLIREDKWIAAIAYVASSVVVGLIAFRSGMILAGRV